MEYREMGRTGVRVPVLGQGTWKMGEDPSRFAAEVEALRMGIEKGMTLIDTAEMYAGGRSEQVVGKAMEGLRERVYLVTKVWPTNGRYDDVLRSADASLKRMNTDWIDLYLLHWPSAEHPVSGTMRAMERLHGEGRIRAIGVSNFSVQLLEEAQSYLEESAIHCNQVSYSLANRVIEKSVLPYCQANGITVMAYSPIGRGSLPDGANPQGQTLARLERQYGKTRFQIALNWVVSHAGVVAIPKAANPKHIAENAASVGWQLEPEDVAALEAVFPLPAGDFQVRRY